MGKVIIGATLSLDGFMSDRQGDASPLYPDFAALHETDMLREEVKMTGAVVMGRRAYEMAQGDFTGYEYQTPIFVLTHRPPAQGPKGQNEQLTVTFVTSGVESAIAQAKAAAGEKQVTVVGGLDTAYQCVRAGLADELHIGIAPLLLGEGLRFFEPLASHLPHLEQIRVFNSPIRTDLWFRIVK